MRVIIDTNVLVSAAVKNRDPEAIIKWIIEHPDWLWLATPEILADTKASSADRGSVCRNGCSTSGSSSLMLPLPVVVEVTTDYPPDQKDAVFVACALAAEADYLNNRRQGLHGGA